MKKTIYIARSDIRNGDSFDLYVGFERDCAEVAIWIDESHMTAKERANTTDYIDEVEVEVRAGETAANAYSRYLEEAW